MPRPRSGWNASHDAKCSGFLVLDKVNDLQNITEDRPSGAEKGPEKRSICNVADTPDWDRLAEISDLNISWPTLLLTAYVRDLGTRAGVSLHLAHHCIRLRHTRSLVHLWRILQYKPYAVQIWKAFCMMNRCGSDIEMSLPEVLVEDLIRRSIPASGLAASRSPHT
jgi:hypothetical protein